VTERTRLTIAVMVTTLLLVAVTAAGIAFHVSAPPRTAVAPVPVATHMPAPVPTFDTEHD
jgi:hypothetical protein